MKVGQATIAVDPVIEKPFQIALSLRRNQTWHVGWLLILLRMIRSQSLFERRLADHIPKHPPHAHRLAAVQFLTGRIHQRLVHLIFGSRSGGLLWLFYKRPAVQSPGVPRGLPALLFFCVQKLFEMLTYL